MRYELAQGTTNKFWDISLDGRQITVTFGRIGSAGQTKVKRLASPAAARAEHDELIAEKTRKGYRLANTKRTAKLGAAPPIEDGAPRDVKQLRALAARAARSAAESALTRVYILAQAKGSPGVMRAGGPPVGVTAKSRPKYEGEYMQHLLTLDLDAMPEIRAGHRSFAKARALALFISDAADNEAFDEDTNETAVVALTDADVARGEWTGPKVDDLSGRALVGWPVDVPEAVFTFERYGDDADDEAPLCKLHDELMSACRAGGKVIFWDGGEDGDPDWVFQFNEDIVDVNLGDAGTMYVFTKSAYWAGH